MKAETRTVYVARDGSLFSTEAQCRAHERETCGDMLIGLTAKQIDAARAWDSPDLAEAFMMFASELRKFNRRRPEVAENNGGDKPGAHLSDAAGPDRAADSGERTDRERIEDARPGIKEMAPAVDEDVKGAP